MSTLITNPWATNPGHLATVTPLVAPRPAPVAMGSVQGTLALDLRQSWEPLPPTALRHDRDPSVVDALVPPTGRAADVDAVAHGFAAALVEVLSGDRGPGQLLRWTTPAVYDDLQRRAALLHRTVPGDRRVQRLRSRVRSIRVSSPRPEAAEVCLHLRRGERSQAVAARLEHRAQLRRGQLAAAWVCVALEMG